jgi:hypothetical protein
LIWRMSTNDPPLRSRRLLAVICYGQINLVHKGDIWPGAGALYKPSSTGGSGILFTTFFLVPLSHYWLKHRSVCRYNPSPWIVQLWTRNCWPRDCLVQVRLILIMYILLLDQWDMMKFINQMVNDTFIDQMVNKPFHHFTCK